MSASTFKKYQEKLELIASDPFSEPRSVEWRDFDRNGMLSIYGLARWTNVNLKSILRGASNNNWGFVGTRHVTFNSIDQCLSFGNNSFNPLMRGIGNNKLFGLPYLSVASYFTETGKATSWVANHCRTINNDEYIAHSIGIGVGIDRAQRKVKPVSAKFKAECDNIWNNLYPVQLKPKYKELKGIVNTHLAELNGVRHVKTFPSDLVFSYKLQLRFMDEDRNYHLNYRSYFNHFEEALNHYFYKIGKNNRFLNYSLTVVYWKEVNVTKYSHCFINIYKIEEIVVNEKNGTKHKGYDFYGCLSVSKGCERAQDNDDDTHEWLQCTGFIARCVDKRPYKSATSKL